MKVFLKIAYRRILKPAAALLLVGLVLAVSAQTAEAGICELALLRCLADAVALAGGGSPLGGLAYAAFCFEGYAFCIEYLQR